MHMLSMTVEMMNKSLSFIASLPHAVVTFYPTPTEVGLCYLILIFLIIYVSRRRLRDLTCLGILCVAEICVNVYEERADRVPAEIVFYNCRRNYIQALKNSLNLRVRRVLSCNAAHIVGSFPVVFSS